jgi:hypothetical protein
MGRIYDLIETRGDLIARGVDEGIATTVVAWGVWIRRTRAGEQAAEDVALMRGSISCHAYLEQIAPAELER